MPDVPHVFKNIKLALVSGHEFEFGPKTIEQFNLQHEKASMQPLHELAIFQNESELKLALKLRKDGLYVNHFNKMKVSNATNVISRDVSAH